jgi:vancomycin permeability regulator SanA
MNVLIILLGCSIARILDGRIHTAVNFVNTNHQNSTIDWFLSGGIKDRSLNSISEAAHMAQVISPLGGDNWNIILDTVATNTAENFIIVNQTVNLNSYSDVYVVTSEFHHDRAKIMTDIIFRDKRIQWVLSPLAQEDSRYWENIHIKNVDADVKKALKRIIHI